MQYAEGKTLTPINPSARISHTLCLRVTQSLNAAYKKRLHLKLTYRQLTNTTGQIDVGGKIWSFKGPQSHSGFRCEAHLLCNYTKTENEDSI